jgi:serine/threonine-protein kinase
MRKKTMARRRKPVDENGVPFEQPFAGYEINGLLSRDDRTAAWRAWDLRMDREVLLAELTLRTGGERDVVEEFFSTTASVARLRHPHLVRAVDTGRSGDRFYLATEFPPGEPLAERLAAGRPQPEERILRVGLGVGRALDALYEEGLVHGAFEPAQIWLDEDGTARLWGAGFPLELLYPNPEALAADRPRYAAPEQFEEGAYAESRTDLYRLGVILYQMATGALPFPAADAATALQQRTAGAPSVPRSAVPTLSAVLSGRIMSLLAPERGDRPRGPAAFLDALAEHPAVAEWLAAEAEAAGEPASGDADDDADAPGQDADAEAVAPLDEPAD